MSKTLSKFKQNFIIRNYKTMSVGDIAKRLKIPYGTVYCRLYDQGLLEVQKRKPLDLERGVCSQILSMYVQGWYLEDIVEASRKSEEVCIRIIGKVFLSPVFHRRSSMWLEPVDSYTGMTESQMRKEAIRRGRVA